MHDSTRKISKMVEPWLRALYTFLDSWSFKMGPIGCPETSVRNYHDLAQKSAVLTLMQLLPCRYVLGRYLVRISSELPVFLTILLNLALFGSVVRRTSTRTTLEWAGRVTEPSLVHSTAVKLHWSLMTYLLQGTSANRNGKISTGLYTELKFYKKRCNDRRHDL
jgi:hypothetical protein